MVWPACSPDLNPIDQIGRMAKERIQANTRLNELRNILTDVWNDLPQQRIRRLIASMHPRCIACIKARGGHISYWLFIQIVLCVKKNNFNTKQFSFVVYYVQRLKIAIKHESLFENNL